jgi:hypothetical protein
MPPKSRGSQELKKQQTTEHYKADCLTPKEFFVCGTVGIRVKRMICRTEGGKNSLYVGTVAIRVKR